MSEGSEGRRGPDWLKLAIAAALLIAAAAVLYVMVSASIKPAGPTDLSSVKKASFAKLEVLTTPRPAPLLTFQGPDGKVTSLAELKGKVVVANLWATWCAPCKVEMPTLSRLAATYQGQPVAVVAISIDKPDKEVEAKAFMARNRPLEFYWDPSGGFPFLIQPPAQGLPTTLIIDKKGMERARLPGEADWSSAEATELVRQLLAEP